MITSTSPPAVTSLSEPAYRTPRPNAGTSPLEARAERHGCVGQSGADAARRLRERPRWSLLWSPQRSQRRCRQYQICTTEISMVAVKSPSGAVSLIAAEQSIVGPVGPPP